MTVNYSIQAEIIDIRTDSPRRVDTFLVDTNVWFWTTYSWASQTASPYQVSNYPDYISQVRAVRGTLYRSSLSFAELAHAVERAEYEIFTHTLPAGTALNAQEFRHNYSQERNGVVGEIQASWGLVKTMAQPLEANIDDAVVQAAFNRLPNDSVDGYDLFILETMRAHGISQVLTDDGDYATVSGLRVFTANQNVISLARAQRKLIVR